MEQVQEQRRGGPIEKEFLLVDLEETERLLNQKEQEREKLHLKLEPPKE